MRPGQFCILLALAGLVTPGIGEACRCSNAPSFPEAYDQATHVFIGKLVNVELMPVLPGPGGYHYPKDKAVGTFNDIETFKGDASLVEVYGDGSSKSSCTRNLTVGYRDNLKLMRNSEG